MIAGQMIGFACTMRARPSLASVSFGASEQQERQQTKLGALFIHKICPQLCLRLFALAPASALTAGYRKLLSPGGRR